MSSVAIAFHSDYWRTAEHPGLRAAELTRLCKRPEVGALGKD